MYSQPEGRPGPTDSNPLIWKKGERINEEISFQTFVLFEGDPGLLNHNSRNNFNRCILTREIELKQIGHIVNKFRVSNIEQINIAFKNINYLVGGGLEFYCHGSWGELYVGEDPGSSTNISSRNIDTLIFNPNIFAKTCVIKLAACSSGSDGKKSIAQVFANKFRLNAVGSDSDLLFSHDPNIYPDYKLPPETGPLYLSPRKTSDWKTFHPV